MIWRYVRQCLDAAWLFCSPDQAITKGVRSLPAIHWGGLPRPDQVAPVSGSRYFASTFFLGLLGFQGKTCWAVKPNS